MFVSRGWPGGLGRGGRGGRFFTGGSYVCLTTPVISLLDGSLAAAGEDGDFGALAVEFADGRVGGNDLLVG